MKKQFIWIWILIILLWAGIVYATSTPTPTQSQNQGQDQAQEQQQGQIQGQTQQATGIGIADSTAISGSNSAAIVGINSENENNNANMNTAFGGQGGQGTAINSSTNINAVNPFTVTNAEAGDSQAEAIAGDSVSNSYSGGNTLKNIYNNVDWINPSETKIRVGDIEYSTDNISGAINYHDNGWARPSYSVGIIYTHAFGTKPAKDALQHAVYKIEAEKEYLNAQINVLNADRQRADEQSQLAMDKATLDIALLCEPFLQGLNVLDKANSIAYGICKNYELRKPREVEKIVEVPGPIRWRTATPKPSPCELCDKEKENKLIIQTRPGQ